MTTTLNIPNITKIPEPPNTDIQDEQKQRQYIAECLCQILADVYTLYLKTQSFHWNTPETQFPNFHQLSGLQSRKLAKVIDAIAQRIRDLGNTVPGSYKEFKALSSIPETEDVPPIEQMIEELIEGNETLSHNAHLVQLRAKFVGDFSTVNLLVEHRTIYEQNSWMLRTLAETSII